MWFLINSLVSPKKFFNLSNKVLPWMTLFFLLSFTYGLIGGLILAPADYLQGDGFRIIYVHAPSAFLSLFIYAVMAASTYARMANRRPRTSSSRSGSRDTPPRSPRSSIRTRRTRVGSGTGAVALRLRFQSPPHQTQRADFPHCAFLLASHQGLWDLSCWRSFRR